MVTRALLQVLAKSLIDYLEKPGWLENISSKSVPPCSTGGSARRRWPDGRKGWQVAEIMDPAYYVPESMTVWNV